MQVIIDKINCAQMVNEILEDGEKLRSLRQLMERYQLSLPFTAYKARGVGAGEFFTIITYLSPLETRIISCSCCGERKQVEGDAYISLDTLCAACFVPGGKGAWKPDAENWKLG